MVSVYFCNFLSLFCHRCCICVLVSVRSGARASMPGMMDTILNLGLNEDVVNVLAEKSGNARWAWDCYRRFIQMYSDVVMEVGKKYFEELID